MKEPAWPRGPWPCHTFSLGLWGLSVWSCGPYPSQFLISPQCKAQALCTGHNFHSPVCIWWLLLLLETGLTEMQWAEMLWIAVWVRKLQPSRTFLLQLLDLLYTLGVKCSACTWVRLCPLCWDESYVGLSQPVWIEEKPGNLHLRKLP